MNFIIILDSITTFIDKMTLGTSIARLIAEITNKSKFVDTQKRLQFVTQQALPIVSDYLV